MPAAMYRIEVQQMRQGGGITGRIIDADDADLRMLGGDTHHQASDATETVDADVDGTWVHSEGFQELVDRYVQQQALARTAAVLGRHCTPWQQSSTR
jgi:hypothetical protein